MDDDRVMGVSSRITPFAGHADEFDDIPTVDVLIILDTRPSYGTSSTYRLRPPSLQTPRRAGHLRPSEVRRRVMPAMGTLTRPTCGLMPIMPSWGNSILQDWFVALTARHPIRAVGRSLGLAEDFRQLVSLKVRGAADVADVRSCWALVSAS